MTTKPVKGRKLLVQSTFDGSYRETGMGDRKVIAGGECYAFGQTKNMTRLREIITSKKHIKRIIIVWLVILIFMSILVGWSDFFAMFSWDKIVLTIITTSLYAFLIYIMAALGMNPFIEGVRAFWGDTHSKKKEDEK